MEGFPFPALRSQNVENYLVLRKVYSWENSPDPHQLKSITVIFQGTITPHFQGTITPHFFSSIVWHLGDKSAQTFMFQSFLTST